MAKPSLSNPNAAAPRTLAIDIGGTGIKSQLLDSSGKPLRDRERMPTPENATPDKVLAIIQALAKAQGEFDRVSIGFPGVVKDGVIYSAPNLGKGWREYALERAASRLLERPVRIANDADIQGLGSVVGRGVELVVTLGTGFGSVLFVDGHRIHLELAHHPFRKGNTYEEELGIRVLEKKGKRRWNKRLGEAIEELRRTFGFEHLYIGGGNTKYIEFELPKDVSVVPNATGLLGGIALWREERLGYADSSRAALTRLGGAPASARGGKSRSKLQTKGRSSKSRN